MKVISEISTVQATILSSQLKEMLWTVNSEDTFQGMCKPIKLVYHPREPFYVIKQVSSKSKNNEMVRSSITMDTITLIQLCNKPQFVLKVFKCSNYISTRHLQLICVISSNLMQKYPNHSTCQKLIVVDNS